MHRDRGCFWTALLFFLLFCLFLPSLARVYGSLSSKYSALVCVLSLLCVHCGMFTHKQRKQTQHAGSMFYFHRSHYYLLFADVNKSALFFFFCCFGRCMTPLDYIWAHLWESNGLFQSNNNASSTTHTHTPNKQTNTPCSKGACN